MDESHTDTHTHTQTHTPYSGGRGSPTQPQASGFIILETNFKVVGYTGSSNTNALTYASYNISTIVLLSITNFPPNSQFLEKMNVVCSISGKRPWSHKHAYGANGLI